MREPSVLKLGNQRNSGVSRALARLSFWLVWVPWSVLLGSTTALLVNTIIFGRLPLSVLAAGWFGSLTLSSVSLIMLVWWIAYGHGVQRSGQELRPSAAVVPGLPLLLPAFALPMIYVSDVANHYFYYDVIHLNQPRNLAMMLVMVLGTLLLQSAALRRGTNSYRERIGMAIANLQEPFTVLLLLGTGILQASAYMSPPGMDFSRYWLVADALGRGIPYAANTTVDVANAAVGMTGFIVDLPVYPVLMAASFALLGHTVAAAYFPIVLFNATVPVFAYLLFREVIRPPLFAALLAGLVIFFPPLRFYTLNFPVPDSIFLASLLACSWLFVRIVQRDRSPADWALFGACAAVVALVRTEGVAYATVYMAVAVIGRAMWRQRAAGLAAYLVPLGLFSYSLWTSFAMPWPHTFAGALGLRNLAVNLPVLVTDGFLISAIRLSSGQLAFWWTTLLALAAAGSIPRVRHSRRVAALFVPAWINLLMVNLADPRVSGARLWFDYFRHVSYVLPLFFLAAGLTLDHLAESSRIHGHRTFAVLVMCGLVLLGIRWEADCLLRPSWNFGPDAVNLLSQERPNFIDYVERPFYLPVLEYQPVDGHSEPILPAEFFSRYPDQLLEFYRPFDAVKAMSGSAYEAGSVLLFMVALGFAASPLALRFGSQTSRPTSFKGALESASGD